MLASTTHRKVVTAAAGLAAVALALTGCTAEGSTGEENTEISVLFDNTESTVLLMEALVSDFEAANPGITVTTQTRLGGADGDNIIKTKLATGEMEDVFYYNSGAAFQALAPEKNLVDLTNEAFQDNVQDSYKKVITSGGAVYGAPVGGAMGGGVLYNKRVYAELGLEVPTTWDEFTANNEAILAAGIVPVIQTYKDTWTSQLFVLGDFGNVLAADPEWADRYTANEAKFAGDPVASAGFTHLAEYFERGFFNPDFASATFDQGIKMVAEGTGVHYPMLTFAGSSIATAYPDLIDDVGVFALPGSSEANPLTTWMPSALYIPATTTGAELEAAKKFLAFVASAEGCDSITAAVGVTGPYVVKDCVLPADVPVYVSDMLPYFETEGGTEPALEFLSPIKGPSLEQITVAVGSGITSAADGASQYDEDVKKQAQQLGLEGW